MPPPSRACASTYFAQQRDWCWGSVPESLRHGKDADQLLLLPFPPTRTAANTKTAAVFAMGAAESREQLSIFVGTWNLGNEPPPEALSWIPRRSHDIYVIGVQECLYPKRSGFIDNEQDWFLTLHEAIGGDKYECVAEQTLTPRTNSTWKTESAFRAAVAEGKAKPSGIRMSMYIKKKVLAHLNIPKPEVFLRPCGRLNCVSGNKGGIAMNIRVGDLGISFISSHLNAHTHELERRNLDFQLISEHLFPVDRPFPASREDTSDPADVEIGNSHDLVIWLGDLNYRIDPNLDKFEDTLELIRTAVAKKDWPTLLKHDQLRHVQESGVAFFGFKEPHINFPPTFKVERKACPYEERYSSQREPSYCDRILYKANDYVDVVAEAYNSHIEDFTANLSDHDPVSAVFTINAPITKKMEKHRALELTFSELGVDWDMDHAPDYWSDDTMVMIAICHKRAEKPGCSDCVSLESTSWDKQVQIVLMCGRPCARKFPVTFAIYNPDTAESSEAKFGQCMLSVPHVDESGQFHLQLLLRGRPVGILNGKVTLNDQPVH
eukprot:m.64136 g.64136  ORF g.64136 m.64136 type:complete len:549 (+) comp7502_c0_seq2:166-1812(+)